MSLSVTLDMQSWSSSLHMPAISFSEPQFIWVGEFLYTCQRADAKVLLRVIDDNSNEAKERGSTVAATWVELDRDVEHPSPNPIGGNPTFKISTKPTKLQQPTNNRLRKRVATHLPLLKISTWYSSIRCSARSFSFVASSVSFFACSFSCSAIAKAARASSSDIGACSHEMKFDTQIQQLLLMWEAYLYRFRHLQGC